MFRVAVIASHPVQNIAPFFRRLADSDDIDPTVLYCARLGTERDAPPMHNFGQQVTWDIDLLADYSYKFLPNPVSANPQRRWSMTGLGLLHELRSERYDAVVNFGWAYPADWMSFALSRYRRLPFLLYGDTNVRDEGATLRGPPRRIALTALCRSAAGGLYTGTFNRDFYVRHGMDPARLWFSPYAVDNARFASQARPAAREQLGLDASTVYIVFSGTLIPRKRPLDVLEAVLRMQKGGARVGAIFAGSGELRGLVEQTVAKGGIHDVRLLGFVNQTELPRVYAAGDILVLPSEKDPRATVVNEAMAAGLPVIVSSGTGVWGPADLVRHEREGLVYQAGNVDSLVNSCEVLLDAKARGRMGAAAARRVKIWSYDTAVAGWREAVTQIVRSPCERSFAE